MQVATTVELGIRPTSTRPLGWSESFVDVLPEEVPRPVAWKSLRDRRSGGVGWANISVEALATVVAVAAAFFVVRCALYLVNASKSRVTVRFLAGAKLTKSEDGENPCGTTDGDLPAEAAPAAEEEDENEPLDKQDLLKRAQGYATELKNVIYKNKCLFMEVKPDNRVKYISEILCLCVVEFAALYSLLARRERAGISETIRSIFRHVGELRGSLPRTQLSDSRRRHIKFLHGLLRRLPQVEPAAALEERQRLLRLKQLLQLQDMALVQLNNGVSWLREYLGGSNKGSDDSTVAASSAEGATAAVGGVAAAEKGTQSAAKCGVAAAEGGVAAAEGTGAADEGAHAAAEGSGAAAEGADAAAEGADAAAEGAGAAAIGAAVGTDAKVAAVVWAIEDTVHTRREQILVDPLLRGWLQKVHTERPHYSIISIQRFEAITRSPLPNHRELIESLLKTRLASGKEPMAYARPDGAGTARRVSSSSADGERAGGKWGTRPKGPSLAPLPQRPKKFPPPRSPKEGGTTGSAPLYASFRASQGAGVAAAAAGGKHVAQQAASQSGDLPLRAPSNISSDVSPSDSPGVPQASAFSAAAQPAAALSTEERAPQGTHDSEASDVSCGEGCSDSPLPPRASPTPTASSSIVAVSAATVDSALHSVLSPGSPDDSPVGSASSPPEAPGTAHDFLERSTALETSSTASGKPFGDFDRAPGPPKPRHAIPFLSLAREPAEFTRSFSIIEDSGTWFLQATPADGSGLQMEREVMLESPESPLQASASEPLPGSPWIPTERFSPSEPARLQTSVDTAAILRSLEFPSVSRAGSPDDSPVGSAASSPSGVSGTAHDFLDSSTSGKPFGDFDRAPGPPKPRHAIPFLSLARERAELTRSFSTVEDSGTWFLQATPADGSGLQREREVMLESPESPLQASASKPGSPWIPTRPFSASEPAGLQDLVDTAGIFRVLDTWGPFQNPVQTPVVKVLPSMEPDELSHGEASAALRQLSKLFSGASGESPGETVLLDERPPAVATRENVALASTAVGAAANTATTESPAAATESGDGGRLPGGRSFK
ncbi:hypothetical protein EBH_0020630 [Eimeria brunetti]|uniref:Uncharacterized protein n=1 Tax=Eimeria brunetti TaxID=51314 RepID=U6LGX6_9EIME|nr:hypothetical protein EBH_0020630 [Eimeria brunetti]